MALPEVFDVSALVAPIDGESPTGKDIREDYSPSSVYQLIKAERTAARTAERQNIHDSSNNQADEHWRNIISQAPVILKDHAKDLEVACWFAEAQLRRNGFAGLRDAFKVIDALISDYWENLHPMPDEYGIETRVACLSGLNGEGAEGALLAPLRKIHLTESDYPGPFSLWQYKQALDAQKILDEQAQQRKIESLGFSVEDINKSVSESSQNFFIDIRDDLTSCISIYRGVGTKLDEHCGIHEAPPTRSIVEVLEECLGAVNHIGASKFPIDNEEDSADSDDISADNDNDDTTPTPVKKTTNGPVATREDAFKQLLQIADFFKKTEPHSPISYILQKAVRWGSMPLEELIGELIPDSNSREKYSELTGVKNDE